jgi:hypothetical protein
VYFDNTYTTNLYVNYNVVDKMSMIAYFKPAHDDIEKLIEKHVNICRKNIPWDGEHKQVVEDIVKIFKRLT